MNQDKLEKPFLPIIIQKYLKTLLSYRATKSFQDILKNEQRKLDEELVGQMMKGDDYVLIFKSMMKLKHEKIMHETLDTIKQVIGEREFSGKGPDFVCNITFDSKTKRFRSQKQKNDPSRNLTNSMLDTILFPLKENYNDRYDRIFIKSIKNILLLMANNHFTIKVTGFMELFSQLSRSIKTARNMHTKQFIRCLISIIFDTINQRLTLSSYFFKSSNPLNFFYSHQTQMKIKKENMDYLSIQQDRVCLKLSGEPYVYDLNKEFLSIREFSEFPPIFQNPIQNEIQQDAGVFGWCFICRKKANFYCKEQRVPICSYVCKLKNLDNQTQIQKNFEEDKKEEKKEIIFREAYIKLFENLSSNAFDVKNDKERIFFLTIISDVVKQPSSSLRRDPCFILYLKKDVLPHLTKTTLHNEQQILKSSLIIFLNIVFNFRKYLREEIGIYIKDVFLQILESPNSKFVYKYYVLQVLTTLIEEKNLAFELFLNYDCREGSQNICQKIIELLVKISQGKYQKNIYHQMISAQQEEKLNKEARDAITNLIKGCQKFINSTEQENQENNNQEILIAQSTVINQRETINQDYTRILKRKQEINETMTKFNRWKKSAYRKLIKFGVLGETPKDLADFLKNDKRVSHYVIGQIFGQEEEFYLETMDHYVKELDFKGRNPLDSMRYFLSLFELPGEGQKVERILEKFATKFSEDNSTEYDSDGAYLCSFLLLMLHTNVYNPQVKDKMTLQGFLDIGKSIINYGKPISPDILTTYFYDIQKQPIAVHTIERRQQEIQNSLSQNARQKQELFKLETEKLTNIYKSQVQNFQITSDFEFLDQNSSHVIQLFIQNVWSSLLAFFSTCIAKTEELDQLEVLIQRTVTMIKLSDIYDMHTERDSFINLLVQFSGLEKTFNHLLDEKNLVVIRAIIKIAQTMAEHLHTGWKFVLDCLITINMYQILADKLIVQENQILNLPQKERNALFIQSYFNQKDINKIFQETHNLSLESIVDYFQAWSELAVKEIYFRGQRAHFILKKIYQIFRENIQHRNVLAFQRIWKVIGNLYTKIVDNNSQKRSEIIIFSIDILRQIVITCFENQKLLDHSQQKEVFKVYENISSNQKIDTDIVEFLLMSFESLIFKLKEKIKIGIVPILSTLFYCNVCQFTFETQQKEKSTLIVGRILQIVDTVLQNLNVFCQYLDDDFENLLNLLIQIAKKQHIESIKRSVELHQQIYYLFWRRENVRIQYQNEVFDKFDDLTKRENKLYYENSNIYFQNFTLKLLEHMIDQEQRKKLDGEYLENISIAFTILDEIQLDLKQDSWMLILEKIINSLLKLIENVYNSHPNNFTNFKKFFLNILEKISQLLLKNNINPIEIFDLYLNYLFTYSKTQDNLYLSCLTLDIQNLINQIVDIEEVNEWKPGLLNSLVQYLIKLFDYNFPHELIQNDIWQFMSNNQIPFDFETCKANIFQNKEFTAFKCRFIINLVKLIQLLFNKTDLTEKPVEKLFKVLNKYLEIAQEFNRFPLRRFVLWQKGYFKDKDNIPSLCPFEKQIYLTQFSFYKKKPKSSEIFLFVKNILEVYLLKYEQLQTCREDIYNQKKQYLTETFHDEEFKLLNYEEKQQALFQFYELLNNFIIPYLQLDLGSFSWEPYFEELLNTIIKYLPFAELKSNQNFRCSECIDKDCCQIKLKDLPKRAHIEDFLQKLISKKVGQKIE